jgi:hypothetical protein
MPILHNFENLSLPWFSCTPVGSYVIQGDLLDIILVLDSKSGLRMGT